MDHPVPPRVQEEVPVEPGDIGLAREQIGQCVAAQRAVDRRAQEADRRPPRQLAARAGDEVVRQRLDLHARAQRAVGDARELPARDCLDDSDVPAAGGPSGQLGGAQDRGRRRRVHVFAGAASLRRAADPARVEELRLEIEEAPVVAGPAGGEVRKVVAALQEEGTLLLEERLVGGEVHDRRVHLDLAEVGVEGPDQRHVGTDSVLDVEARRTEEPRAVVEWIARPSRCDVFGARRHVRQKLEMARRRDPGDAFEMRHA